MKVTAEIEFFENCEHKLDFPITKKSRPSHRFKSSSESVLCIGEVTIKNHNGAEAGIKYEAHVEFIDFSNIENIIKPGVTWGLYAGPEHLVGEGKVLNVL